MSWAKRLARLFLSDANRPGSRGTKSKEPRGRRVAVEPLEDRRLLSVVAGAAGEYDFGDLPDNYGTTMVVDGARHEAVGPTLGATRDAEADGLPSAGADGDGADEDGVTFGSIMVGQLDATATVNVQNAPSGAKLDAWVDFNGDGSFGGPWEHIASNVAVAEGDNAIEFDVPSWVPAGEAYARFRLSSDGNLGWSGAALDGEVEDYQFVISSTAEGRVEFGPRQEIFYSDTLWYDRLVVADFNDDGHLDLVTGYGIRGIDWLENDGSGQFTWHPIATRYFIESLSAADINGDGHMDLLLRAVDSGSEWFENDGSGQFTPHALPVRHTDVADLNGDGLIDILGSSSFDGTFWLENNGDGTFAQHAISVGSWPVAINMDGDGDLDLVVTASGKVVWWENDGDGNFSTSQEIGPGDLSRGQPAADFNANGYIDMLRSYRKTVSWIENDPSGFVEHAMRTSDTRSISALSADMDGDGDSDVVTTIPEENAIVWFQNDGTGSFAERSSSTFGRMDGYQAVGDMDQDGRLDLVLVDGKTLFWQRNGVLIDDFGDAPDSYGTRLVSDGARHEGTGPTLGSLRDIELDGLPAPQTDGDDEDGVTLPTSVYAGQLAVTIAVNVQSAPSGAKLDAWIDFDGNGVFDAADQIAASLDVSEGDNLIQFDVPASAVAGTTYARFRLSTAGGLEPTGGADDGEVEDYALTILSHPTDFGDAPDIYATTLGSDGARHSAIGPTLGSNRDAELDGQPTPGADGDDGNGTSDEDGVTFGSMVIGQVDATVGVNVQNAPSGAKLDGWIDFNQNGTFEEGEQIASALNVSGGDNPLIFGVPLTAVGGDTYARFRLSSDGNLAPTGGAADGEVEDYAVTIIYPPMDLGDLPESFGTTLAAGGPWHVAAGPMLGATRDAEADGVPSTNADGDGADEDGVIFSSIHYAEIGAYVTANIQNAPSGAELDAWIDFDRNGTFEAGEQIATSLDVSEGDNVVTYDVPSTAVVGVTYARFRLSTDGGLSPTGGAADGEVEDYAVTILPPVADYGDAPDRYATTYASNGARHEPTGPTLGATRDTEADGLPTVAADGDGADEDGVTFGTVRVGQLDASVTVNVQNAPSGAKLDAWIDFNGDGSFGGAGERIASSLAVVEGDNLIQFDVPSWAVSYATYSRFRLSSEGTPAPSGGAGDGEVEDHLLTINPATAPDPVFAPRHVVADQPGDVYSVVAADVNRDGRMDVLAALYSKHAVVWYENLGDGTYIEHQVGDANSPVSVFAVDLNGDGFLDVLAGASGETTWYENDGSANFTARSIDDSGSSAHAVHAADLNADGHMDVLSVSMYDNTIVWYEYDGNLSFTKHLISDSHKWPISVEAVDVNGDGYVDVFSGSSYDGSIVWYENDGSGNFSDHTISSTVQLHGGDSHVTASDLNGDGHLDLLSVSQYNDKVAWYENDGAGHFSEHVISLSVDQPRSVFAADVNGDGHMDVLLGSVGSNQLIWYENDGTGSFTEHALWDAVYRPNDVVAADGNGDGRLDLLVSDVGRNIIFWYENTFLTDFGDAPDDYGTSWASDGPRHLAVGPQLGATRDAEADGLPTTNAAGDDDTEEDDEDGVVLPASVWVAQTHVAVTVSIQGASAGAKLDAWVDFDRNGTFDESERIASSLEVVDGDNPIEFDVPVSAVFGRTYARFRLSTAGNLGPTGAADDGEVEDYELTILAGPSDLGDAPENYRTSLTADGPWHVATGPRLGAQRDTEVDGTPTTGADGDDTDGADDEDGVTFDSDVVVGQLDATVTVNVQNAPSGALLDAWIDFDGDGTFAGPGEHVADSVQVENGDNAILFDVPSWSLSGETYARFRLSSAGDLGPAGAALDGEVEDHLVTVTPAWAPEPVFRVSHDVARLPDDVQGPVAAGDFNGDGHMDIVSGSRQGYTITWHENDGNGNFTQHTLSSSRMVQSLFVEDVNGDGRMDFLAATGYGGSWPAGTIDWYENDGNGGFTRHIVDSSPGSVQSVIAADLNGDGYTDILSASKSHNTIAWYENDGHESFIEHDIDEHSYWATSVFAADLNGDGRIDVLAGDEHGLQWYKNCADGEFTEQPITTDVTQVPSVFAADLNGDGHMDLLAAHRDNAIAWFENDGYGNFTEHSVGEITTGSTTSAADLDGDGDMDVFSVARLGNNEIAWFENDGAGTFAKHTIAVDKTWVIDVLAVDINADGRLDVLASGMVDGSIIWYENTDAIDYGDAPESYGTTVAADGARHWDTGPTLGETRDVDSDGLPSAAADGDDTTTSDDEDGVSFTSAVIVGRAGRTLTVNVQNAPDGAKLDAWIDFDGNGTFDAADQIADSIDVVEGDNTITFDVPESAVAGETYARFRLSTAGDLAPTGSAADGEVEDYRVTIYEENLDIPRVDLGTIDFLELPGVDLSSEPKAWSFATMYGGFLTVDATLDSTGGEATIRLIDDAEDVLGEATTENGYARIDHLELTAGKSYALQVAGTNADVDLEIWNLVEWADRTVTVHGTDGADEFAYTGGTSHGVAINGIDYQVGLSAIDSITFDGEGGENLAVLTGSAGDETASFVPGSGSMTTTASGFVVSVAHASEITVNGGGGTDNVELEDSTGDDTLVATPTQMTLSGTPVDGNPYSLTANHFSFAHAYARQGGNDTAEMTGSEKAERVKAYPEFVRLHRGNTFTRTKFFETVTVDTLEGNDNGVMVESDTADALWAMNNDYRIARGVEVAAGESLDFDSVGYGVTIAGCEQFVARTQGGDDWLELHDTPGKDVLIAKPHKAQMMNAPRPNDNIERGEEYTITARGFRHAAFIADQGGEGDVAKLYDSGEDGVDIWAAAYHDGETWSSMSSPTRLLYEALAFEQVGGYGFNGGHGDDHGTNRKDHAEDVDFVFQWGVWEQ